MKTLVQLNITKDSVSEEIWNNLKQIAPAEVGPHSFSVTDLSAEDSRLKAALYYLSQQGIVPATGFPPRLSSQFSMTLRRTYDSSDLVDCAYLTMIPSFSFGSETERDENGVLHVPPSFLKENPGIGVDWQHSVIVSDQMKNHLESNNFIGVTFSETILGPSGNLFGSGVAFWEMSFSLTLPPLAHSMSVVNDSGKPFDGDYSKGCRIRESMSVEGVLFLPPELHYQEGTLKPVEPFDLALTYEKTGRGARLSRRRIVSKRFYDFCQMHQLDIEWQPVRIDE